ncbi:cyclic GMP-AMP synthase-like receptor isoform X2 [Stomoxys calcitrans]|uniref:cyclic GMP-AMP synthase-like receptor isoform X2 n=1 Tax=Stomoxys calcitrans TaxID=35570 RepID=UPI0027E2A560|nr:cyclic GMP-AMP synthase-like receptor isoform X2 [Stomoxys calcitrans]
MSGDLKPNLEAILIDINHHFINIDKYRQEYALHFQKLKNVLFDKLRKTEPLKYLFNGYLLAGSCGDNLKITLPNEFDMIFQIKFPENGLIDVVKDPGIPGNIYLDFTKVLRKIRNEKQHATIYRHMNNWLNALEEIIGSGYFCQTKLSYSRQGPAHTIKVNVDESFSYSVDFVPGIILDGQQSVLRTKNEDQWECIPKPIFYSKSHQNVSFRSSFVNREKKLLKRKENLKNTLRFIKKFRDAHSNMGNMKSYYIKMVFLWKAVEVKGTNYWQKSLTQILLDMFASLESCLREKTLKFFWDPQLNMFDKLSSAQLQNMLICVASGRKLLEEAALNLTMPLQTRVYEAFGCDINQCTPLKNTAVN